jgi:N utilization substance protein B
MRTRTLAREAALKYLYAADMVGPGGAEPLERFLERQLGRVAARGYAADLARGVLERRGELDRLIREVSANWTLERMSVVDRNVLRMGAYELLFREDVPPRVAINEAIDLARRFSTVEAGAFVNGILDALARKAAPERAAEGLARRGRSD